MKLLKYIYQNRCELGLFAGGILMIGAAYLHNRGGSILSSILVFTAGAVIGTVSIIKGAPQWEEK